MKALLQSRYLASAIAAPEIKSERKGHVTALFEKYESAIYGRTHRLFMGLLCVQWFLAIAVAYAWTPLAWYGNENMVHEHLMAAIFLGGLLVAPALALMAWAPNETVTRHVVAVSQLGFSNLLIHLSGGRIETHFHVFGSLAFLALYRDWRVLPTAIAIVGIDHFISGLWFPSSIYGSPYSTVYRTYEHVGWVLFEGVVLAWSCVVSRREMWLICEREDDNKRLLAELESRLTDRTAAFTRSQERTNMMIRTLPIGIFETARTGEILFANESMLRTLGVDKRNVSDLNILSLAKFNPGEREKLWEILDKTGEVNGFETVLHFPDGTHTHLVIHARLKTHDDGRPSTCEGSAANITMRKKAEKQLEELNAKLVAASRQVGMAEAATGVLHNVGNVLTSVNLTVHDMQDRIASSRISHLRRVVDLIDLNQTNLAHYITTDPTGTQVPGFLINLAKHLEAENKMLRNDMVGLSGHFEHIREIIVAQQSSARVLGIVEDVSPTALIEDALRLAAESFERHHIGLEKSIAPSPAVRTDRHKVLQILINLLKNAKDALLHLDKPNRKITVRIFPVGSKLIGISVSDNGAGIPQDNLTRIFHHGFTTKKDGHGFGLHSAAIAAKEIGGELYAQSEGLGCGSTFTLQLPVAPVTPAL